MSGIYTCWAHRGKQTDKGPGFMEVKLDRVQMNSQIFNYRS